MTDPHESRACGLLNSRLDESLSYIAEEFDVTNAAMIGVLMFKVHELLHSADEDTEE